ncbi:MAG: TOBE domain-containing protein [Gammaproteobacteria bacterium]|nr:TOBE domain-containing protein [Gammaproteobacteria bacterium]
MKISARNVLPGKILNITHGAVNTEVTLELRGGPRVVSIISRQSADGLKLRKGRKAYAVIKASNVMIAVD